MKDRAKDIEMLQDTLQIFEQGYYKKNGNELLEVKKRTTKSEENPQMPVIIEFIESETARQKEIADNLKDDYNRDWTALNSIFAEIITGKEHS